MEDSGVEWSRIEESVLPSLMGPHYKTKCARAPRLGNFY